MENFDQKESGFDKEETTQEENKDDPEKETDNLSLESGQYIYSKNPSEKSEDCVLSSPERGVFGVFDGVGRAEGAAERVATNFFRIAEALKQERGSVSADGAKVILEQSLQLANRKIIQENLEKETGGTGASTATVTQIIENEDGGTEVVVANTGDSRVYKWSSDTEELKCITTDDSVLSYEVEETASGLTLNLEKPRSEEEIRELQEKFSNLSSKKGLNAKERFLYENRHRIAQVVGGQKEVDIQPKTYSFEIEDEDLVLMTTDGVHDSLRDETIEFLLSKFQGESPENLSGALGSFVVDLGFNKKINPDRAKGDDVGLVVISTSANKKEEPPVSLKDTCDILTELVNIQELKDITSDDALDEILNDPEMSKVIDQSSSVETNKGKESRQKRRQKNKKILRDRCEAQLQQLTEKLSELEEGEAYFLGEQIRFLLGEHFDGERILKLFEEVIHSIDS